MALMMMPLMDQFFRSNPSSVIYFLARKPAWLDRRTAVYCREALCRGSTFHDFFDVMVEVHAVGLRLGRDLSGDCVGYSYGNQHDLRLTD